MKRKTFKTQKNSPRSGLAAVEFALCLPLLILLVLGSIEAANAIFLRQAMTIAAYETAQIATSVGGTEVAAKARGNEILATYNLKDATIQITPTITSQTVSGTMIEVSVTAPSNSNSVGPPWLFKDAVYTRKFSMIRL